MSLLKNTPCGVQAHGEDGYNSSMMAAPERLVKVGTDLLSAGLQQVPQMLHQLGKGGSVGGTVQPAVQHDLISTEEGRIKPESCEGACSCSCWGPPTYISVGAYSGGLILVPSLSLLQKDSSMQTPGYGEAPAGERRK